VSNTTRKTSAIVYHSSQNGVRHILPLAALINSPGARSVIIIIIVYYATKAANIHTHLHIQEHNKKI